MKGFFWTIAKLIVHVSNKFYLLSDAAWYLFNFYICYIDDSSGIKIDLHPVSSLMPNTPYTRKESLPSKDGVLDPVANATNNVKKLREISNITEPSEFIR